MENYRKVDHTTREFNKIANIWTKNGITPDKFYNEEKARIEMHLMATGDMVIKSPFKYFF